MLLKNYKRCLKFAAIIISVIIFAFGNGSFVSAKIPAEKKHTEYSVKNHKTDAEILSLINKYQAEYFNIVKRNDLFLDNEAEVNTEKDRKDLEKLYKTVESQITDKSYLKKYKDIEKRYAKCDEITTIGINEFAKKNYDEIDSLLNEVYKKVKSKISPEDFNLLTQSERKWLKEVDDYHKVFDSMGYGTIGTMIYYSYQIDMRNFRTLLLMLYL